MSPLDPHPAQDLADIDTIGIPRALLYYRYRTLWETFFREIGRTVIVSDPSDRGILEAGERLSVDECCLASKLYLGHVERLIGACDAVFVPSVGNFGKRKSFCTKFQALPDLVSSSFEKGQVRIASCLIDEVYANATAESAFAGMGMRFGCSKKKARAAWSEARKAQEKDEARRAKKQMRLIEHTNEAPAKKRPLKLLIAAHPYVVHDPFIGGPIVDALADMGGLCPLRRRFRPRKSTREKLFLLEDPPLDRQPRDHRRDPVSLRRDRWHRACQRVSLRPRLHDQRCGDAQRRREADPFPHHRHPIGYRWP